MYVWVRFCSFLSCQYIGFGGVFLLCYFITLIIFFTADNVTVSDSPGTGIRREVGIKLTIRITFVLLVRFYLFLFCDCIGLGGPLFSCLFFITLILFSTADNVIQFLIAQGLSFNEEVGIEIIPIDINFHFTCQVWVGHFFPPFFYHLNNCLHSGKCNMVSDGLLTVIQ